MLKQINKHQENIKISKGIEIRGKTFFKPLETKISIYTFYRTHILQKKKKKV